MSDVVAVSGLGAEPQRIYVAALGGRVAFTADYGAHWTLINPPAFPPEVPAAIPIARVRRLAGGNLPGHAVVYAVTDGPRLWRIDGNAVQAVSGLPADLVREDPDTLKPFVLAITVHPANDAAHQDVIAVGGQTCRFPGGNRRHAALFKGQVTLVGGTWTFPHVAVVAPAPPAEWIGSGMPPRVQTLAWVLPPAAADAHLWVGGDGGAFRSTNNGALNTFAERNTGLGTFDVTTFAQARDADTVMIAAQQRPAAAKERRDVGGDVPRTGWRRRDRSRRCSIPLTNPLVTSDEIRIPARMALISPLENRKLRRKIIRCESDPNLNVD